MCLIRGIDLMVTDFAQIYATLDGVMNNLLALRLDKRIEFKRSIHKMDI